MRRASASKSASNAENVARRSVRGHGFWVGALAVTVAVSAPASAFADEDGDDAGQLGLNTTVLVNDSVGTGSLGEFAIRGSLFSADLSARVQEQREAAADRLTVARTLDFAHGDTSTVDYRPVRAALFEGYTSQEGPRAAQERNEASPAFFGVAAVIAVPRVLGAGLLAGRLWARRKRAAS